MKNLESMKILDVDKLKDKLCSSKIGFQIIRKDKKSADDTMLES